MATEKHLPKFAHFNKAEIDYRPKLLPFLGFVLYRKMSVIEPPIHLNFFLSMILVYMQKNYYSLCGCPQCELVIQLISLSKKPVFLI
jgi:hypothetical protein